MNLLRIVFRFSSKFLILFLKKIQLNSLFLKRRIFIYYFFIIWEYFVRGGPRPSFRAARSSVVGSDRKSVNFLI